MGPAVEPPATPLTSNNVDSMDAIGLGSDHEATEIDPASPAIEVNSGWAPMQHIYPEPTWVAIQCGVIEFQDEFIAQPIQ